MLVDRIYYAVSLVADIYRYCNIFSQQAVQCDIYTCPAILPTLLQFSTVFHDFYKLLVSFSPFLLTVRSQKISPSAKHIAVQMLHDHRDAVALRCRSNEELFRFYLRKGFFTQQLIIFELPAG